MKLDPADVLFSRYVRARDNWSCVRCGKRYDPPTQALQCSHYFGRTRENVRFDLENCDALCHGCHRFWEKEDREAYRVFKVKQLGQKGYDALTLRANTYKKKDRKFEKIKWQAALKELEDEVQS